MLAWCRVPVPVTNYNYLKKIFYLLRFLGFLSYYTDSRSFPRCCLLPEFDCAVLEASASASGTCESKGNLTLSHTVLICLMGPHVSARWLLSAVNLLSAEQTR